MELELWQAYAIVALTKMNGFFCLVPSSVSPALLDSFCSAP